MPRIKHQPPSHGGPKVGLVCRTCGCQDFRVVYVKHRPGGVIVRRRECRHCGRRAMTREVQV
jgi:transcriptional regulator NrdR family protein